MRRSWNEVRIQWTVRAYQASMLLLKDTLGSRPHPKTHNSGRFKSNVATSKVEEEWDAEASFAFDKEDFAFTTITSSQNDFEKHWIVDSVTRVCYTSQNVVFDEVSSWWSSDKEELPESSQIHSSLDEIEDEVDEGDIELDVTQSPWQTAVHEQPNNEDEPIAPTLLRRSTRVRKPNPKYANAAITKDDKEPEIYEEASQHSK
ncbi:hypothetical protein K1719_012670 [Acacia pycnantha]|nr:hypothetical protein K1719_012670 [Acacia pycnantha]